MPFTLFSTRLQVNVLIFDVHSAGEIYLNCWFKPMIWNSLLSRLCVYCTCLRTDVCVKLRLLVDGRVIDKKKTSTRRRTVNPVYNESFSFHLPHSSAGAGGVLDDNGEPSDACSLSVSVVTSSTHVVSCIDVKLRSHTHIVSSLVLGRRGHQTDVKHWKEMLAKPRQSIAQWHYLRPPQLLW